jgi:hypothetical protein
MTFYIDNKKGEGRNKESRTMAVTVVKAVRRTAMMGTSR